MAMSGDKHLGETGDGTEAQNVGKSGTGDVKNDAKGDVANTVSNDMSDAKEAPKDTMPKDNSHNFT